MSERYSNATYVGRMVSIDDGFIEVEVLSDEGAEEHGELESWPFRNATVAAEAEAMDLREGDRVAVYVEFSRYTAVRVAHFDLAPRRLHERLLRIERQLGLEEQR